MQEHEKIKSIDRATRQMVITFATASFGRGIDFICRDKVVELNNGVHVIQTFLSKTKAEFEQIKGRTARQGNKGSYQMILLEKDLQSFDIEEFDDDSDY